MEAPAAGKQSGASSLREHATANLSEYCNSVTPTTRLIWEMHCYEICMMAYEINLAARHTTGTGLNV